MLSSVLLLCIGITAAIESIRLQNEGMKHQTKYTSSWGLFIDRDIMTRLVKSRGAKCNLQNLINVHKALCKTSKCLNNKVDTRHSKTHGNIHSPCGSLQFTSWIPLEKTWIIQVPVKFVVNITIEQAYVPYNIDENNKSVIAVHEKSECVGTHGWNCGLIRCFSGHVYYESIYTKENIAIITIKNSVTNIQFPATLMAVYQVVVQGLVYMVTKPNLQHLSNTLYVNKGPEILLFENQSHTFMWYTSNSVSFCERDECASHTCAIMNYFHLLVSTFRCQHDVVSFIYIYPGLLSNYLRKWKIPAWNIFSCNLTETLTINTTFHMYTTVVLEMSALQGTDLQMDFIERSVRLAQLDNISSLDALPSVSAKDSTLQAGILDIMAHSLHFTNFTCEQDIHSNVMQSDILTSGIRDARGKNNIHYPGKQIMQINEKKIAMIVSGKILTTLKVIV